jgi:hypothetical protein
VSPGKYFAGARHIDATLAQRPLTLFGVELDKHFCYYEK